MKKFVVLLFIQLFFTTVVLAQVQIGSFYGLELGMTMSEVRSALSSQGKTMESKEDYYRVDSPKLGDITFDALWLYFKDSKLAKAEFFCFYGKAPFPNDSWYDQAVDMVSSKAQKYKMIYDDMHLNLVSKYGKPQIDGDEKAVWRKGMNQITLLHRFNIDKTFDFHEITTRVEITYESISKNINY
jgi:hypothetical protein